MEDPDLVDPYRRKTPGDGQGYDMNRPGNEETRGHGSGIGSGLGTRFRRFSPIDFSISSEDDYSEQIKRDIPVSDHYLQEDYGKDRDPPTELIAFDDERDSPFLFDILNGRKNEPIGPHNQQRGKIFDRVLNRLR